MAPEDTCYKIVTRDHSPSLHGVCKPSRPHPHNPISTIHYLNFQFLPFHHPRVDGSPGYIFPVYIALLSFFTSGCMHELGL
ncbi:hypothetical protein L873DRAFT_1327781 [Choiromyces venosus 120613-1]|uniref:Uncharacterized protein n=1 Tax=Choiromyces venosus 120613-1 TaxID=1336337 RepID=A0A3N4JAP9_9PEZI|nr:hypothetical protein L873DRAFT_1327781 [Choiromyces venosus 120613-1]